MNASPQSKIQSFLSQLGQAPLLFHMLLCLLIGITLSFTQAPYNLWPLLFPCFSLFYILLCHAKKTIATFGFAFLFLFGYFTGGLYWIGNALLVEGNEYKWAWPLAVIALPALLSLIGSIYITLSTLWFNLRKPSGFIAFCVFLGFAEWVRGYAFTGFPWNLYGYSWIGLLPVAQISYLCGPYVLTFLTILWGCCGGFYIQSNNTTKNRNVVIWSLILSFVLSFGYGFARLSNAQKLPSQHDIITHVIQPNIPQSEKWKAQKLASHFEKIIALSQDSLSAASNQKTSGEYTRHILIWPETAIPPSFIYNPATFQRINNLLDEKTILLSGAMEIEKTGHENPAYRYRNALFVWEKDHPPRRIYTKSHLVPFGEYIPFADLLPEWSALKPITGFNGFEQGQGEKSIQINNNIPALTPLICYEIIFPYTQKNPVNGAKPQWILTITNDAWYGDSPGPYQHFTQARFRAIEQKSPVIRAANTGISGIIDPYGRIISQKKLKKRGKISAYLPILAIP